VCRLGATVKIIDGAYWTPALWDKKTSLYRNLSNAMEQELDNVYRNSLLADWYEKVEIEGFG
jgi:hypothetical protein